MIGWKSTAQDLILWKLESDGEDCRFRTKGKTLPEIFHAETGRKNKSTELMLRFDNNMYEGAVYGYETSEALIAGQTYTISFDYHIGNGGEKNFWSGVATSMDYETAKGLSQDGKGSEIEIHTLKNIVKEEVFKTHADPTTCLFASFTFEAKSNNKHFVTFRGDRDWFGISNLSFEIKL